MHVFPDFSCDLYPRKYGSTVNTVDNSVEMWITDIIFMYSKCPFSLFIWLYRAIL